MRSLIHRLRSDDALMLAFHQGDAHAFESLYARHKDGLFAFLYRSCGDNALSEEIAQDTWMAVVKASADYERRGHFKTWLYQIGRHRLYDHWRRGALETETLDEVVEPIGHETPVADHENMQRQNALMQAVAALPPEQRDTLLLQEQGFSLTDIATITDSAAETVKSRLRYARKSLRQTLNEIALGEACRD